MINKENRNTPAAYRVTVTDRSGVRFFRIILIKPSDIWTLNIAAVRTSEAVEYG